MFASSFTETEKSEIVLREVEPAGVKAILNYFYTATIELDSSNFEAIFATANLWQVEFVLQACEHFLEQELSTSNCLGIQILVNANLTFTERLRKLVDGYVNAHFMEICEEEEILTIPKEHFKFLLVKDELCVSFEEFLFESVLRWLKHDVNIRGCYATELMSAVRLGLLRKDFIQEILLREKTILENSSLNQLLNSVVKFLHGDQSVKISEYLTRKRKCEVLYVFGGFSSNSHRLRPAKAIDSVEFLNVLQEKWENFPEAKLPDAKETQFKLVAGDGYLYAVGHKIFSFCLKRLVWEKLYPKSMGFRPLDIKNAGVCFSNGCIYVIGGVKGAQKFNPSDCTWYKISSSSNGLVEEHYRPGVCAHDDVIYVIGGCDSSYNDGKDSVESFVVESGVWLRKACMCTARWGLEAIPLKDRIFAVGGYNTEERCALNTVEVFTPSTDTWQNTSPLTAPRRRFGSAVVNGMIYVVGGYEVESVEYYDEVKERWVVVNGLTINRFDCSCWSMQPPNCL
ncbi:kelch-like protein 3 [Actinia tenebrosa]|uniref:Kelch-like protein 3 n=1 Tax=Actinia tenebrosa TaxID=6105 RepID=A0A6P8HHF6_ACTTE|nr:kelch-like protein 3 [Actinia tenebrosa]